MTKLDYFKQELHSAIQENAEIKEQILDIYNLCMSESEDPSTSLDHEIDLGLESLKQLLEDNKEINQGLTDWETQHEREL
jgi:hypothetical protein